MAKKLQLQGNTNRYDGLKGKNTRWLFVFGIFAVLLFLREVMWIGLRGQPLCDGLSIGGFSGGYITKVNLISRLLLFTAYFGLVALTLSLIKRHNHDYKIKVSKIMFILGLIVIGTLIVNGRALIFC